MSRKVIAVDIDDVLAAHIEGFIAYSNRNWGTNLSVDDYDDNWAQMWGTDHVETERRAEEFHLSGEIGKYRHFEEARTVLEELVKRYELIIITSRRKVVSKETKAWIKQYFPGFFSSIRHAGFWDEGERGAYHLTKAELCKELGADYLIDDQVRHCFAAAEAGITALLFGDYPWSKTTDNLPPRVIRCHDWPAVQEFFAHER